MTVDTMADASVPSPRKHHLRNLGNELRVRGLESSLLGHGDETVLCITEPVSRRHAVAVAAPSTQGWFYLWPPGGIWPVDDPGSCADRIFSHLVLLGERRTEIKIFRGKPEEVGRARRIVSQTLGTIHPCHDDAVLLVSEIATNAIRHSTSGTPDSRGRHGIFWLVIRHTASWARITVHDTGSANLPCVCRLGIDDETSGRGLTLIENLSRAWGFERNGGKGTNVWFEVEAVINSNDSTFQLPRWRRA